MKANLKVCAKHAVKWVLLLLVLCLPQAMPAQWKASVGAQSKDLGRQALAFLPNEIWIHEGESITWTLETDEIHTVSFLQAGQTRLPFQVGCPGVTVNSASFDGSTCVTTPAAGEGPDVYPAVSAAWKLQAGLPSRKHDRCGACAGTGGETSSQPAGLRRF